MSDDGRDISATTSPDSDSPWDILLQVYGQPFLQYVLNLSDDEEPAATDEPRAVCVSALAAHAAEVLQCRSPFEWQHKLAQVVSRSPDTDLSWANAIRLTCSGSIPVVEDDDPALVSLATLAIDMFAVALLPSPEDDYFPDVSEVTVHLFRHPNVGAFESAVLDDPALSRLFPSHLDQMDDTAESPETKYLRVQSECIWSLGGGGSMQLSMVAQSMLSYTYAIMSLTGQLDIERVTEHIARTLATARQLAAGRRSGVPIAATLANVQLGTGVTVDLVGGGIRPADYARRFIPFSTKRASLVLFVLVDMQLLDVLPGGVMADGTSFRARWNHRSVAMAASMRSAMRELDRARLSMILASDHITPAAPVVQGTSVFNPLCFSGGGWGSERPPPRTAVEVDGPSAIEIHDWSLRLRTHPESLWLGARRLLSAITERLDPLDGFIDAIIAWENMLGTGEGETTFRVCAGMALLLSPDDSSERVTLFREFKNLYRARSGLVHGAREPRPEDAVRSRDRAVEVAILATRAIHGRPELRDAGSSEERSRLLLLGS